MTDPRVLKPGDACRLDGYLRIEDGVALATGYPALSGVDIAATGAEELWRDVEMGVRYTIRGTWDGQVVRANSCERAACQDRIARPGPESSGAAVERADLELQSSLPGSIAAGVYTTADGKYAVQYSYLPRWTSEAIAALAGTQNLAVIVMCGHEDDSFPSSAPSFADSLAWSSAGEPAWQVLEPADQARACGYLVKVGSRAYLCPHWSSEPERGVKLSTPFDSLRGGGYLRDWEHHERDRYLAYVVDGIWQGDYLEDDGYLNIASCQDFTLVEDVELQLRFDPHAMTARRQKPLAVLVGHPGDRFVWHRGG